MVKLQILGTGCPKCQKLAEQSTLAAEELGIEFELEKVTNIDDIMRFGVYLTPALVVNGAVKVAGRVPTLDDIKKMITA